MTDVQDPDEPSDWCGERTLDDEALAKVRARIDGLDDEIHRLIEERTALAGAVAQAKRLSRVVDAVRPAREAKILRRLLADPERVAPDAAVVQIWRELIGASISLQGRLRVAAYVPDDLPACWDHARDHFGHANSIDRCDDPASVFRMLREGEHAIGVMPAPQDGEAAPWWATLIDTSPQRLRVILRLPFTVSGDAHLSDGAMAIAVDPRPEPSGDDRSLLAVRFGRDISRASVAAAFAKYDMPPTGLASQVLAKDAPAQMVLVEVEGYVTETDPRLEAIVGGSREGIEAIHHLGAYPAPLNLAPATAGTAPDRELTELSA